MNPSPAPDPRGEREARLTALLLGELPPAEAEALRCELENDPQLAALHDDLARAAGLLRETVAAPAEPAGAQPQPLRLSEERRQKLLAHFQTAPMQPANVAVADTTARQPRDVRWLLPLAAAVAVMFVGASLFFPALSKAKRVELLTPASVTTLSGRSSRAEDYAYVNGDSPAAQTQSQPISDPVGYYKVTPSDDLIRTAPEGQVALQLSAAGREELRASDRFGLEPANRKAQAGQQIVLPAVELADQESEQDVRTRALRLNAEMAHESLGEPLNLNRGASLAADAPTGGKNKGADMFFTSPGAAQNFGGAPLTGGGGGQGGSGLLSPGQRDLSKSGFNRMVSFDADGSEVRTDGLDAGVTFNDAVAQAVRADPAMDALIPADHASRPAMATAAEPMQVGAMFAEVNGKNAQAIGFDWRFGGQSKGGDALQVQSEMSPANSGGLITKSGAGELVLNGGTTYGGGTTVRDGALTVSGDTGGVREVGVVANGFIAPQTLGGASGSPAPTPAPAPVASSVPVLGDLPTLGRPFRPAGGGDSPAKPALTAGLRSLEDNQRKLAEADKAVAALEPQVAKLRTELGVADIANPSAAATMEPETLRRYEQMAREVKAESAELNKLVDELRQLSPEQRSRTLNSARPDKLVADLLDQKQQTEQRLAGIQRELGEQHPDARRTAATLEKVNAQLADREEDIMRGLQARANSVKARQQQISAEFERAKKLDMAAAEKTRPYFDAKRELEKQKEARDMLRREIAGLTSPDVPALPAEPSDPPLARKPAGPAPVPQPEVLARDNAFSTFSLNVSDVAFKLAAASLAQGQWPDPASVRAEEFLNAFDYRDPEAAPGAPLAFAWERARAPFAHNRDLLRFSVKTAASGRQADRPLHLTLVLDNSGSMERADRVRIVHAGLRALAGLLQPADTLSVITFARTPRLWVDGAPGADAAAIVEQVGGLTPQGGTNLEEALKLAYATAERHYRAGGVNHVVLLTDGAANLGDVDPASLQRLVETHRRQGIALDCFGVGWEGFNDDLLETLARRGDGRYGFLNSPAEAATQFAGQLAGALRVAAADVKVQVEFNPRRVTAWRQVGYAKHQLTKEQFRDNTVDAAELAAREAGNALYAVEVDPRGEGPLATVRARFRVPDTGEYREHAWEVPFTGNAPALDEASPALRLAATAAAFAEWLASSPFAAEVTADRLLGHLRGVPEVFGADARAKQLEEMVRQAKGLRR